MMSNFLKHPVYLKAIFVLCENHSLILAGVHAVGSSAMSRRFFAFSERIYTFFDASTHRWDILVKSVPIAVKQTIQTR